MINTNATRKTNSVHQSWQYVCTPGLVVCWVFFFYFVYCFYWRIALFLFDSSFLMSCVFSWFLLFVFFFIYINLISNFKGYRTLLTNIFCWRSLSFFDINMYGFTALPQTNKIKLMIVICIMRRCDIFHFKILQAKAWKLVFITVLWKCKHYYNDVCLLYHSKSLKSNEITTS